MERKHRWIMILLPIMIVALLLPATRPAQASEAGRRNTAIGLGALSAYLFTRGGSKVPAFLAAGATAYAYKRYQDAINARHRREAYYAREQAYRASYLHAQYVHHQAILAQQAHHKAVLAREARIREGRAQKTAYNAPPPVSARPVTPIAAAPSKPTNSSPVGGGVAQAGLLALAVGAGLGAPKLWAVMHSHLPFTKV